MKKNKLMTLCMAGIALMTGLAEAANIFFTNAGLDNNWHNPANWTDKNNSAKIGLPGENDAARLRIGGGSITITGAVTVGAVHLDPKGAATLIIDGGKLFTTSTTDYNCASYTVYGSMIVRNGGSAVFNGRFFVGFSSAPSGSLVIYDGTVRVANTYHHNETYTGTDILNTRTTINSGGVLDVDDLVINAGTVDIAGGTLIVRRRVLFEVDHWIINGRMIAMGGNPGWKVKAIFDENTGWTTIVAEPVTEPFTVGKINSVVAIPSVAG